MPKLVITLTTIPPRMEFIGPTLESLIAQSADVDQIILYVPKTYRRKEFGAYKLPVLPKGVQLRIVETDYGPATKVLPAVKEFENQDVKILFCDDDRIYDKNWAQRFVEASEQYPEYCVVERGGYISRLEIIEKFPTKNFAYRLRRLFSLGMWKPFVKVQPGLVDILAGFGGVLVKPLFFSEEVFDIPDVLWTVDDIWLSGNLAVNGVGIWLNPDRINEGRGSVQSRDDDDFALHKLKYKGHGRNSADVECVKYYRANYGIWLKGTSNQP